MKIPESNGYKPVSTMREGYYGGMIEHVPRRFIVGDFIVTVFSPSNLSVSIIQAYLCGSYSDDTMRSFDPWEGRFISGKVEQ
jgi:hypothetical protein